MKLRGTVVSIIAAVLMLAASYALAGGVHTATVVEAETGGGYTYMNVDENGARYWVAGPETQVAKGATVLFAEQMWMLNFTSKALNRTFDKIMFVGAIKVAGPAPGGAGATAPQAGGAGKAEDLTIAEVFSRKDELKGRQVRVRGNVVKVSENIMGRNWVHVQDGTGPGGAGTLIFRTAYPPAAVGATVTAEGRVETDRDFGFGYFYPVIVEDSTITE